MSPPFLSEYKRPFAIKRCFQNLFGGARILYVPFQLGLLQLFIFILPIPVYYGVDAGVGDRHDSSLWKLLMFGFSLALLDNILTVFILILKKERNLVRPRSFSADRNFLAQEDFVAYEGIFSPSTWAYISPNTTLSVQHIVAVAFSSLTSALVVPLLNGSCIPLRLISLLVLCTSRFSAVFSAPPEIATFDSNQRKSQFYRPFYVGIIGFTYFIIWRICNGDVDVFPYITSLSLLPLGWGLGFLPPLDALFPWLIEVALIGLGGSPSYFYFGSLIGFVLAMLYSLLAFITGSYEIFGLTMQCAFSYLILLDTSVLMSFAKTSVGGKFKLSGKVRMFAHWLSFVISVCFVALLLVLPLEKETIDGIFMGAAATVCLILQIVQMALFRRSHPSAIKVWTNFLLQKILTLLLQGWICLEIEKTGKGGGEKSNIRSLLHLISIALNIRAFSRAILHSKGSTIDMMISAILKMATGFSDFPNEIEFTTLIFFVSLLRSIVLKFWGHIVSIIRFTFADFASPLLENKSGVAATCLIGLPMTIASVILASIVSGTALTPLFTLPFFILAFPRPMSFWKGRWFKQKKKLIDNSGNIGLDEAIYASLSPPLVKEFVKRAVNVGIRLELRDSFVGRYEDRLIFMRILGIGWNFLYIGVKGLEMQEQTSCHHQESAWMDEIFESRGKRDWISLKKFIKGKLTVVEPLIRVKVPSYSESRSTIPPISMPREKDIIQQNFFKAFSYLWIKGKPAFKGEAYYSASISSTSFHSTVNTTTMTNSYGTNNPMFDIEVPDRDKLYANMDETRRNSFSSLTQPPSPVEYSDLFTLTNRIELDEQSVNNTVVDWKTKWIKKCVGESIPSIAIKDRMEKLTSKIWKLVHSSRDFDEIKLHRYFEENFLLNEAMKLKSLDTDNIIEITTKAFRYGAKLTLDEIYQMGILEDESSPTEDEIFQELTLYERYFKFCTPNEIPVMVSSPPMKEGETIVSFSPKEEGMSQMKIFTYDPTGLKFHIGRMDEVVLEGVWTNLNLELLYLTSDDDERFSIQHDRHLMRNLLTECADSPLGYPVYENIFKVDLFRNFRVEVV